VVDESAGWAEGKLFSVEELKGTSVADGTDGLISVIFQYLIRRRRTRTHWRIRSSLTGRRGCWDRKAEMLIHFETSAQPSIKYLSVVQSADRFSSIILPSSMIISRVQAVDGPKHVT
jgi:hypothetical protein